MSFGFLFCFLEVRNLQHFFLLKSTPARERENGWLEKTEAKFASEVKENTDQFLYVLKGFYFHNPFSR